MLGVVADELDPGAADRGVVLLRCAVVTGDALDAVADNVSRRGGAVAADGEPGYVDVLAVPEVFGARHDLTHQLAEWGAHDSAFVSAFRTAWNPATARADRPPSVRCSRSARVRVMAAAASR